MLCSEGKISHITASKNDFSFSISAASVQRSKIRDMLRVGPETCGLIRPTAPLWTSLPMAA
jgi:hypothetical protein